MFGLSVYNPFTSRAVLFMTDDGITLYSIKGKQVTFIRSEPWKGDAFEVRLAEMLAKVRGASITILNDAVEQHYRKERVVVMTMLDKKNMVQRRLNVAFPNYSMRAAMPLKLEIDKNAKTEAVKGDPYLFAAVPSTEAYARLVRTLSSSEVGISGYGLLPVESVGLVKALAEKLAQRWGGTSGALWTILIGHHHGGGLRQIVVRGNELALTRVTPVEAPDPDAKDIWSGDVSQELQATLSYLSRFGYAPEDGINIIVVGDTDYASHLETMITVPCNFEAIAPENAALLLGFRLVCEEDRHFSEGLHAGWVAKKMALTLPLTSRDLSAIANPRRTATAILLVLNLGLAGTLFVSSNEAQGIYFASSNLEVAESQKKIIDKIYQDEVARKERMGIDVNLIKGSLNIHDRLLSQRTDILALIRDASRSLETIRLDGFEYKNMGLALRPAVPNAANPNAGAARDVTLVLKVSFAGTVNPKDGNKDMEDLRARISNKIESKGFSVVVSKLLEDQTYTGEVTREVGLTAISRLSSERFHSEITIKKVGK